ncbi:MAG: hypothetical protein QM692_06210 [Thermomicrobiales bacterium]
MDGLHFDQLARTVGGQRSRRAVTLALGAAASAALVHSEPSWAKNKKKPKKKPICVNGVDQKVSGDKRKKLLKNGATAGPCPAVPPPCVPQCNGTTCSNDGCGGTCACNSGAVCDQGVCTACAVVCNGDSPAVCGTRLAQALLGGGKVVVCPGRYLGAFNTDINNTTLIGAGSGDNPAVDTILVASANARPLGVPSNITAFVSRLRITGGSTPFAGGGVRGDPGSVLFMDQCAVVDNKSTLSGSGISSAGRLTMTRSTVSGNGGQMSVGGGGLELRNGPHLIEDSVIAENLAFYGGSGDKAGGGLYCAGNAIVDIRGTEISENACQKEGGGIYLESGSITLDAATRIVKNEAGYTGAGGGIYRKSGNVFFNGATVTENKFDNCAGTVNFTC